MDKNVYKFNKNVERKLPLPLVLKIQCQNLPPPENRGEFDNRRACAPRWIRFTRTPATAQTGQPGPSCVRQPGVRVKRIQRGGAVVRMDYIKLLIKY